MKPISMHSEDNRIDVLRRIAKRIGLARTGLLLLFYIPFVVVGTVLHTISWIRSAENSKWFELGGVVEECMRHAGPDERACATSAAGIYGTLIVLFDMTLAFGAAYLGSVALARFLLSEELRRSDKGVFLIPYLFISAALLVIIWGLSFSFSIVIIAYTTCNPAVTPDATCLWGEHMWAVIMLTFDVACIAVPIIWCLLVVVYAEWRNFCDPRPAYEKF